MRRDKMLIPGVPTWFIYVVSGIIGLMIGWLGNAWAWPAEQVWQGLVDHVETVEVNSWPNGSQGVREVRTALIYRDADRSIVDWRMYTDETQIPKYLGDGRYMACWKDQGKLRTVYCRQVRYTKTASDRELAERSRRPDSKYRRLSR